MAQKSKGRLFHCARTAGCTIATKAPDDDDKAKMLAAKELAREISIAPLASRRLGLITTLGKTYS